MSIEKELKEAIITILNGIYQVAFVEGKNNTPSPKLFVENEALTALLPIIAKYAVSLVELDEGKVIEIIKLNTPLPTIDAIAKFPYKENGKIQMGEYKVHTALYDTEIADLVRTLATSQIIKGKN